MSFKNHKETMSPNYKDENCTILHIASNNFAERIKLLKQKALIRIPIQSWKTKLTNFLNSDASKVNPFLEYTALDWPRASRIVTTNKDLIIGILLDVELKWFNHDSEELEIDIQYVWTQKWHISVVNKRDHMWALQARPFVPITFFNDGVYKVVIVNRKYIMNLVRLD